MLQSMRIFLLFLSSLLSLSAFSAEVDDMDSARRPDPLIRYSFQIETSNSHISGILLLNETDDCIKGSMINEFGISAISFSYSKKKEKIKLLSVVNFLNKWYIKRVLREDLKYCLHVLLDTPYCRKHGYEVVSSDGAVSVINKKRHLKYSFSPLPVAIDENDIEQQPL